MIRPPHVLAIARIKPDDGAPPMTPMSASGATNRHSFLASAETLLTPYFALADWACSEMNRYRLSRISSIPSPAASIASR